MIRVELPSKTHYDSICFVQFVIFQKLYPQTPFSCEEKGALDASCVFEVLPPLLKRRAGVELGKSPKE